MASTGFRWLDVGRVAGVKLESDFLGMVLFFVVHRLVSSDRLLSGGFG